MQEEKVLAPQAAPSGLRENKMGTKPVFGLILSMSLPAMFSMLVLSLYNIVDSYFVAQTGGDPALAALSLVFPIQMLLVSFGVGTGIGINSLVSRRLGENRRDEADRAASHSITLGVITGLVFAALGAFLIRPFLQAFHPSAQVFEMASDYAGIVVLFSIGSFVEITLEKTIQATGNMIFPMLFQLSGAITNLILDPILIFGLLGAPALGIRGAAIATVTGQFVAMTFALVVVFVKNHEVKITLRGAIPHWATIREIYRVGIPSILMQSISAFLNTFLNLILIQFSQAAVAVMGLYYKIQSFVFMPVFGLTHGLMPILGFNYGARKKRRILSALRIGFLVAGAIMLAGLLLFELIPDRLLAIFNTSPELLGIGVTAFRLIALSFLPAAVGIISSAFFQAIGMGAKSLLISLLRQLVLILPLAYLFSLAGLNYVWLSFPIAEVVALVVAVALMLRVIRKHIHTMADVRR